MIIHHNNFTVGLISKYIKNKYSIQYDDESISYDKIQSIDADVCNLFNCINGDVNNNGRITELIINYYNNNIIIIHPEIDTIEIDKKDRLIIIKTQDYLMVQDLKY